GRGSAGAVACGRGLGALGAQTGGSITRPASYCGVAACKPTYGYAAVEAVLPLAASMDHPGPMARCVEDVEVLTRAIASAPQPREARLGAAGRPTFARLRGLFDRLADGPVRQSVDQACEKLRQAGATVLEIDLPPSFEEVLARHRVVMAVEAAQY